MILKFKNNYQTSEDFVPNPPSDLFIGGVSADTLVDPINVCNTLELSDVVYIKQQNIGYITNGDLVFFIITWKIYLLSVMVNIIK